MRRVGMNALRLGLTFGLGLFALRIVSAEGAAALSLYLYFLGARWTCQFLVDATEAAQVAAGTDTALPCLRDLAGPLVVAACLHLAATLAAMILLADDWGLKSNGVAICGVFGAVQVCGQILMAPRLAALISRLQMGRYNAVVILRRLVEVLALGLALKLGLAGPDVVIVQSVLLGVGASAIAASVQILRPCGGAVTAFRVTLVDHLALGLSNSLGMRVPVVILPWVGGADLGLVIGLVVVFLGYARQAGGVLVAGLDGVVRHNKAHVLAAPVPVGPGLAALAGFSALGVAGAPALLSLVLDPSLSLPPQTLAALTIGLRIAVLAAACRLVADAAVKVATGLGGVGQVGRRLILPAGLLLVLWMGAAVIVPPGPVLIVFGLGYAGLQLWAVALLVRGPLRGRIRLWRRPAPAASPAVPSLPAG